MAVQSIGQQRQRQTRIGDNYPRYRARGRGSSFGDHRHGAARDGLRCELRAIGLHPRNATNTVPGVTRRES